MFFRNKDSVKVYTFTNNIKNNKFPQGCLAEGQKRNTATPPGSSVGGSKKTVNSQVIGGSVTTRGQYPWTAHVVTSANYLYGGSLIHGQWVLTAASVAAP